MEKDYILEILKIGENCEIEFKSSKSQLSKSIWSTYSAFCNSNGGIIVLGIIENKNRETMQIEGVDNIKNILKDFWNTINNRNKVSINILNDNDVRVLKINDKNIIVISIHNIDRTLKPVYINNNPMTGTYKRNYEGDYLCTDKEVKNLITESSINTKDTIVLENMTIENVRSDTLQSYRNRFRVHKGKEHEWNSLSDNEFLKVIGAIDRNTNNLTVAGLLIFGNESEISKVTNNYFLDYREILEPEIDERWSHRITSWDGNWSGNLFDFYNKIVNRLISDIEIPFTLDKQMTRIEDTEIHKCIREALVNTLVHTQFYESGSITIEKGINYFKFANPGNMRIPYDRAKQGGESDPRNKLIHKIFSLVGLGERAGSGIYKISNAWKEKKWVEPEVEQLYNPDRTILKLQMKKIESQNVIENVIENVVENVLENLEQKEKDILDIIMKNSKITQKEIAEQLNISIRQVSRKLKLLKEKGIIKRMGSDRKGFWEIIKKY